MRSHYFDALLDFSPQGKNGFQWQLKLGKESSLATFISYPKKFMEDSRVFVRVITDKSLFLKWKDKFQVYFPNKKDPIGQGLVLYPDRKDISKRGQRRRIHFLPRLIGTKEEMLFALTEERGINGLSEDDIFSFSGIGREEVLELGQKLEADRQIRILSFAPVVFYSVKSISLLEEKLIVFLADFHEKNPGELGISSENLKKKLKIPSRLNKFILANLIRENKIVIRQGFVALKDFRLSLSSEEQEIIKNLEKMARGGELQSISFEDMQNKFNIPPKRLNMLLSILTERKKIIQGKEGYFIHADWLKELINKLRDSERQEITVYEFKKMTGLTRKYAIPLLELLDKMGVTRRSGPSTREIIKS